MNLTICVTLGILLPFVSGVLLMEQKTLLSFFAMSAGVFFALAAIGASAQAN